MLIYNILIRIRADVSTICPASTNFCLKYNGGQMIVYWWLLQTDQLYLCPLMSLCNGLLTTRLFEEESTVEGNPKIPYGIQILSSS